MNDMLLTPIKEYIDHIIFEIVDIEENIINDLHTTESERKFIRDSVWRIRESCDRMKEYFKNLENESNR